MSTPPWHPALPCAELRRDPRGVELAGVPVVLFRDRAGRAHALLDRCPHRWVPLSMGTRRGDRLACVYHGWEFDGAGVCHRIPSNVDPEGPPLPRPMATAFETAERDGQVWVRLPDMPAPAEPAAEGSADAPELAPTEPAREAPRKAPGAPPAEDAP